MHAFNLGIAYAGSSSITHLGFQRIWSQIRTCTAKYTPEEYESGVINLSLKSTASETLRNGQEESMNNDESYQKYI
jgi:hypothetical protein